MRYLTLLGILIFSFSCNNAKNMTESASKNNYEVLYISEYGGSGENETKVFTDETAFGEMWNSTINQFSESDEVPGVDFTNKMVVVKSFESQRSGGFVYKVESVNQMEGRTMILYSATMSGDVGTMAITNPMIIVAVEKQENSEVNFVLVNAR